MKKETHKWVKKDLIAAHVYRWVCEDCCTEAFNIDNCEGPSHCCISTQIRFGNYVDTHKDITHVSELMSCSECAIKGVIT